MPEKPLRGPRLFSGATQAGWSLPLIDSEEENDRAMTDFVWELRQTEDA